jgi:hypothetical protein
MPAQKKKVTSVQPVFFFGRRKALQDKAMERQTSTNQRDAPGQDTGRSRGHLISYLPGGAPAR